MKTNRVTESDLWGRPRLNIHLPDSRPSWRRFGDGVANFEAIVNGSGVLSLEASETAFAGAGDKRDVTRGAMLDLDKAAALALRDFLNRHYPESAE